MKGRYKRLCLSVQKWVGAYEEAHRCGKSGCSQKDIESEAHKIYEQDVKSKFNDIVVYNDVMSQNQKWALPTHRDTTCSRPECEVKNEEGGGSIKRSGTTESPPGENYANPRICFFHVLFKAGALAFYILSALFSDSFVIIFVVTVLLSALDFWVVKNVSGRILVGLRWWNEIDDNGESVWKFECLDQESLARMNKKDSWLFWWTLYLTAVVWIFFGIFSLIRFQADYLLVVGVCLTLSIANIVGFTKCRKDAKKQIQQFASQTIANQFQSTIQSAFSVL
ncbi:Golgi apparatus membrane protein-like protein ECHIDNA [Bidens hawaiensis]|uniref:Golgi apparatus membrane protein-like protein ECHIDNA n=1 Tax=Bidens hawaiensis TaxID=980011 RepID=UPI00404B7DE6